MKTLETITTICGYCAVIIGSIIAVFLFIGLIILLIDEFKDRRR